jgi:hypothetical protein
MARPRKQPFNGANPAAFDHDGDGAPGGSLPKANTVTVTVAGKVHKGTVSRGQADTFDVGDVIEVTAAQADSLRAQGFAE